MSYLKLPKPIATHLMPYIVVRGSLAKPRSLFARSMIRYRLARGRAGALPRFIIVGTQRGGTTSLYDMLLQHPQIYPALAKEIHYFDRHFEEGEDWYRANFSPHVDSNGNGTGHGEVTGESTPCYLFHPYAPKRIAEAIPDVRIIVLLRNPVHRAFSHYNLMRSLGLEGLPFDEALRCEPERTEEDTRRLIEDETHIARMRARYSYVARGKYIEQLPAWFETFPRSQILVLQSEAMYADPAKTAREVTEFLDLPDWKPQIDAPARGFFKSRITTSSKLHSSIGEATQQWLTQEFEPYNQALFSYLGCHYDWEG